MTDFLYIKVCGLVWLTDYSHGFGGKFGVQSDRQDKSASGWDHIEKVDKHESQKGKRKKVVMPFFKFFVGSVRCIGY